MFTKMNYYDLSKVCWNLLGDEVSLLFGDYPSVFFFGCGRSSSGLQKLLSGFCLCFFFFYMTTKRMAEIQQVFTATTIEMLNPIFLYFVFPVKHKPSLIYFSVASIEWILLQVSYVNKTFIDLCARHMYVPQWQLMSLHCWFSIKIVYSCSVSPTTRYIEITIPVTSECGLV